jgi:hypothetical protein
MDVPLLSGVPTPPVAELTSFPKNRKREKQNIDIRFRFSQDEHKKNKLRRLRPHPFSD